MFIQLWAVGRAAVPEWIESLGHKVVGPSAIPEPDGVIPQTLNQQDTEPYVQAYVQAAKNAVFEAGFDGIEINNAHGFLLDQFLQNVSNDRTDEFGGSVENMARLTLMIMQTVVDAIGEERAAIRFSPFSHYRGMGMPDPYLTFKYVVEQLRDMYPRLAYIHFAEPRMNADSDKAYEIGSNESLDPFREVWDAKGQRTFISGGGYMPESAERVIERWGGAVVFGRYFISNPDLPYRIENRLPFARYDRAFFYDGQGTEAAEGYSDYKTVDPVQS